MSDKFDDLLQNLENAIVTRDHLTFTKKSIVEADIALGQARRKLQEYVWYLESLQMKIRDDQFE